MKLAQDVTLTSLPNVFFVKGDLLTHPCDLIVHQCNCVTTKPAGLAAEIFKHYPEADIYSKWINDANQGIPGTCVIIGHVAAIFGQFKPGKATSRSQYDYPEATVPETNQQRIFWFKEGLQHLEDQLKPLPVKKIAFPYLIGCGLAGGDWQVYLGMIADFARRNPHLTTDIIVKDSRG